MSPMSMSPISHGSPSGVGQSFHGCPGLYRQAMWMKHFGHTCLKRTLLWSISEAVQYLDLGPIKKNQHKSLVNTAIKYQDKSGKRLYKGAGKDLKRTQFPVWEFIFFQFVGFALKCWSKSVLFFLTSSWPKTVPPTLCGENLGESERVLGDEACPSTTRGATLGELKDA